MTRTVFFVLAWGTIGLADIPMAYGSDDLEEPQARQGYFLSAGAVSGVATSRDDDLGRLKALMGGGGSFRLGQMITPWLGLGLHVETGMLQNHRWEQMAGGLLIESQLVPWRHLALHLGAGIGFLRAKDKKDRITESKGTGGAHYGAGLSYDFFPWYERGSGGFAITPTAQARYYTGGGFNGAVFWLGIECTWWSGLKKQELQLDPNVAFVRD